MDKFTDKELFILDVIMPYSIIQLNLIKPYLEIFINYKK